MKITEKWLKEQGWKVSHYDLPVKLDIFNYATKMFGKDKVFWNDRKELKIFRDYSEEKDVYADILIDNVDTIEKLYQSLDLCGLYNYKEYDWLYETWLNKACDILWDIIEPYVNTSEDCEVIQNAFRKTMSFSPELEGIKTCNSDKNLRGFDAKYMQSKIDAFSEAIRKDERKKIKESLENKHKKYTTALSIALQKNLTREAAVYDKIQCLLLEIINELFKKK